MRVERDEGREMSDDRCAGGLGPSFRLVRDGTEGGRNEGESARERER